jgi:hypothetical protein
MAFRQGMARAAAWAPLHGEKQVCLAANERGAKIQTPVVNIQKLPSPDPLWSTPGTNLRQVFGEWLSLKTQALASRRGNTLCQSVILYPFFGIVILNFRVGHACAGSVHLSLIRDCGGCIFLFQFEPEIGGSFRI